MIDLAAYLLARFVQNAKEGAVDDAVSISTLVLMVTTGAGAHIAGSILLASTLNLSSTGDMFFIIGVSAVFGAGPAITYKSMI